MVEKARQQEVFSREDTPLRRRVLEELRDRALVYVLAYYGVRGGEILSDPRNDRRNGLR